MRFKMKLCEKTQTLISGYIDQELTQQERQLVQVHIDSCESCKTIHADLLAIKKSMGQLQYPECEEKQVDKILNDSTTKNLSIAGWMLIIIPLAILFALHIYTIFSVGNFRFFSFKTLFILLEAGLLFLFISVVRQRLIARKTDKYKGVKL